MSKIKLIIGIVMILLVVAVFVVSFYFIADSVNKDEQIDTSLSYFIRASNESGEQISINYVVIFNDTILYKGVTSDETWEEFNISENVSQFKVFLYGDDYYTNVAHVLRGTKSIDMTNMQSIGNIYLEDVELNKKGGCNNITFYSNSHFRGLAYCVVWSSNIKEVYDYKSMTGIFLRNKELCENYGYSWIEYNEDCGFWCKIGFKEKNIIQPHCSIEFYGLQAPSFLSDRVVKCWWPRKHVTKEKPVVVEMCYEVNNDLNSNDYIKLFVFDTNRNLENKEVFENSNGEDIGANTYVFIFNITDY